MAPKSSVASSPLEYSGDEDQDHSRSGFSGKDRVLFTGHFCLS